MKRLNSIEKKIHVQLIRSRFRFLFFQNHFFISALSFLMLYWRCEFFYFWWWSPYKKLIKSSVFTLNRSVLFSFYFSSLLWLSCLCSELSWVQSWGATKMHQDAPINAHSNSIVYDFENLKFKFSLMPTVLNDFENFNFKLFPKALCSKWSETSNSIFSLLMPIVVNDLENLKYKYFHNAKPLVCADFCPRLHAHRTHFHIVRCKHPHPHAHKKPIPWLLYREGSRGFP